MNDQLRSAVEQMSRDFMDVMQGLRPRKEIREASIRKVVDQIEEIGRLLKDEDQVPKPVAGHLFFVSEMLAGEWANCVPEKQAAVGRATAPIIVAIKNALGGNYLKEFQGF